MGTQRRRAVPRGGGTPERGAPFSIDCSAAPVGFMRGEGRSGGVGRPLGRVHGRRADPSRTEVSNCPPQLSNRRLGGGSASASEPDKAAAPSSSLRPQGEFLALFGQGCLVFDYKSEVLNEI